ncbi:MAG: hypothetical protein ACRDCT_12480 [Shewanella sp.]
MSTCNNAGGFISCSSDTGYPSSAAKGYFQPILFHPMLIIPTGLTAHSLRK